MADNTTFIDAIFRAIDRVSAPVGRMQRRIGRFTRAAQRNLERLNRVADKVSAGIKKGMMVAAAAVAAFGAAAAKVIEVGADFEQSIVSAAVKFPGKIRKGTQAFKELEDAARQTGASTEFSATQSAQALDFLAMAGFNAEQAIAALPGVVDLATASGVELAEATDMASDSLGAFGMMSDDTATLTKNLARVNDVLAKTTTSANTTMEDMFEAIREGATTATKSGASIETFSALIGEMANAGIKGSKAGTTLKNVFLNLQAPAAAGRKALAAIGLKTTEKGKLKDINQIFGEMKEKLSQLGEAKQAQILKDVFGKIALPGALVLLQSGKDKLDDFRESLEGAGGAAAEMAAVMRDTTAGSINSLKSAVEGVIISIFKLEDKGVKRTVDRLTDWVRANEELIVSKIGEWLNMLIDNFETIVKWAEKIGMTIAVFWAFNAVLKATIAVMTVVNLVMAANPAGLVVLAIVALIAAFASLVIWAEEVVEWFDNMSATTRVLITLFAPWLLAIEAVARAAKFLKENWEPIMAWFEFVFNRMPEIFDAAIASVRGAFFRLVQDIIGDVNSLISFVSEGLKLLGGDGIDFRIDDSAVKQQIAEAEATVKRGSQDYYRNRKFEEKNKLDIDGLPINVLDNTRRNLGMFGDTGDQQTSDEFANDFGTQTQMITPQDRNINTTTTNQTEVIIKTEQGTTAEVKGKSGPGVTIQPQPTGAY
jgi:TP901 family phage tail tape measure protein